MAIYSGLFEDDGVIASPVILKSTQMATAMATLNDDKKNSDIGIATEPVLTSYEPPEHPEYHAKLSWGKKLLYHLWDNDQHLKSPEERKLVRKLDAGILTCA